MTPPERCSTLCISFCRIMEYQIKASLSQTWTETDSSCAVRFLALNQKCFVPSWTRWSLPHVAMWKCSAVWFYFCSAEHFPAYSLTSVLVLLNKKGGSVQSYLPFHVCDIRNLRPKVTRWKAQGSLVSHLTFFTYNVISFRNTMILLCSDSFWRPVQKWAQSMHQCMIAKWSCNFSLVLGLSWSHVIFWMIKSPSGQRTFDWTLSHAAGKIIASS